MNTKALKLTGAIDWPKAPGGRSTYGWIMEGEQAGVFLTYCTNAVTAQQEVSSLRVVFLPADLQMGAVYGLTVLTTAPPSAATFAAGLLAPKGQEMFSQFGFGSP